MSPMLRIPLLLSLMLLPAAPVFAAHALAQFGEPKYPAGFDHFDYANPQAPKGGVINLSLVSQNSSFDKYNPFTLKGKAAPGLLDMMFETLTINSLDEPNTQYGLLADDIRVAPDFSSVTFHINPKARFSNGDPVTAKDVLHSFKILTSKKASPRFKSYFSEITQVVPLDAATVRFDFERKGRDLPFVAGSLPVFSPKWGLRADGSRTPFDELKLEKPVSTGAYVISSTGKGLNVVYTRRPDYWANDLPVRRGFFNFDKVVYKLYKDRDTQVAALRAGDYDFLSENQMRYWCCQYIGRRFDDGELIKKTFPSKNPPAMNGWVVNLRRPQFQDPRVREALNYTLDFEWINKKILDNEFKRVTSYFDGTPLQAKGLPDAEELKLLEPYRKELPPAVFGPMYEQPNTSGPNGFRKNLRKSLDLFAAAGWHYQDGVLRNAQGQPFAIEISGTRIGQSAHTETVNLNLAKAGVLLNKKLADAATTRKRMTDFDFDYTALSLRESRMPATELWRVFNSHDADVKGSENIIGVKSAAVDDLIQRLLNAKTQHEQEV
ncbi:MAG TPA: extracellular solute-binding protein, partial [Moraxellaceae bacterium]